MSNPESLYYPEDFFQPPDLEKVQAKIGNIALGGPDQLQIVADFDRTMTTNGPKDLTSWDVVSSLLPEHARQLDEQMYHYYAPRELNHTLSLAEAEAWWSDTLQLYVDSGVNIHDIHQAASSIRLRDGVVGLFRLCEISDVDTTILSAGLSDVINVVNKTYNIKPTRVLSTPLTSHPDTGVVTGWDPTKVIHILNKGVMGSSELVEAQRRRPNIILVGDAIEDTAMVEGDDNVLRIRLGDQHRFKDGKVDDYLEESYAAGYDLIHLGNFGPILDLAAWIINRGEAIAAGVEA